MAHAASDVVDLTEPVTDVEVIDLTKDDDDVAPFSTCDTDEAFARRLQARYDALAERERRFAAPRREPVEPPRVEYWPLGVVALRGFVTPTQREAMARVVVGTRHDKDKAVRQRDSGSWWIDFNKVVDRDARDLLKSLGRNVWSAVLRSFDESEWRGSRGVSKDDVFPKGLLAGRVQATANVFEDARHEIGFHKDKYGGGGYKSEWLLNVNLGPKSFIEYKDRHWKRGERVRVDLRDGDALLFDGNHIRHRAGVVRPLTEGVPQYLPPWGESPAVRLSVQLRSASRTKGPRILRRR